MGCFFKSFQFRNIFKIRHVFYDPVAEYMDKFFRWIIWLYVCSKGQFFHHNLLLFCSYVKHAEEMELLDKLLNWLHWKRDFA